MELSFTEELAFFNQVDDYKSYVATLKSLLGRCHSQEELDTVKDAIEVVKDRLMTCNPEFRMIMDSRMQAVKLKADYERAIHRADMSTARNDAERQHTEALAKADRMTNEAMSKAKVDDWVANTKYKTYEPDEKKRQLETGIGCPNPKCGDHGKNRGNTINSVATCMSCMHRLVPRTEYKEYNRKYWRNYNRRKKK